MGGPSDNHALMVRVGEAWVLRILCSTHIYHENSNPHIACSVESKVGEVLPFSYRCQQKMFLSKLWGRVDWCLSLSCPRPHYREGGGIYKAWYHCGRRSR